MANETISGCRSVALHCVLKFAKTRMKRSSALSTLQNGIFRKGALILIPTRKHATLCLSLTFSYVAKKLTDIQNTGKRLAEEN